MQGVQEHPQKFWFDENPGKIPENPGKIHGNLGKICENYCKVPENLGKLSETTGKSGAQRSLICKNGAQRVQNHMKTVLEVIPKTVVMKSFSH